MSDALGREHHLDASDAQWGKARLLQPAGTAPAGEALLCLQPCLPLAIELCHLRPLHLHEKIFLQ